MTQSDHPTFGYDADLPGGTLEDGESPLETAIREVLEEANVTLDPAQVVEVYSGSEYSTHNTNYTLYVTQLDSRPHVTISWEHHAYEWVNREEILETVACGR